MKLIDLVESVSIAKLRKEILSLLLPYKDKWVEALNEDDVNFKFDFLDGLQRILNHKTWNVSFVLEDFPDSTIATGQITNITGHITIFVNANTLESGPINLLESPLQYLKSLTSTICHELIHRQQLDRAGISISSESSSLVDYLKNKHEIQAYAKDAVDDLALLHPNKEQLLAWIKKASIQELAFNSRAFDIYVEHFHQNPEELQTWNRFLKYFQYYLGDYQY